MHSLSKYPLSRVLLVFIIGILVYRYSYLEGLEYVCGVSVAFFFLTSLFLTRVRKLFAKTVLGFNILFLFFCLGYLSSYYFDESNSTNHLLYHSDYTYYKAKIIKPVSKTAKGYKTTLEVQSVRSKDSIWYDAQGKVYAYFSAKRGEGLNLSYGDYILIKGQAEVLQKTSNPHQFDFKTYSSLKNIFHNHFIKTKDFQVIDDLTKDFSLYKLAYAINQHCQEVFDTYIDDEQSRQVISALVLGVKEDLDLEIRDAYSNAGAMHVLAVSGLHVGILVELISLLFVRLPQKRTVVVFSSLLKLSFLWGFAMVTGLSPSVTRACMMFSLFEVGTLLGKKTSVYNIIFSSAFILLATNPFLIYDVGFQLSYVAVIGIVYFQPKFSNLIFVEKGFLLKKTWDLTAVAFAAQLSTFPITILYFNNFPTYFWLSNFLVIPSATIAVSTGLLLLASSRITSVAGFIGNLLSQLLSLVNFLVKGIQFLPFYQLDNLSISQLECIMIYTIIVLISVFFYLRNIQLFKLGVLLALVFSSSLLTKEVQSLGQCSIRIYQIPKHQNFVFMKGNNASVVADSILVNDTQKMNFFMQNDFLKNNISEKKVNSYPNNSSNLFEGSSFTQIDGNLLFVSNGTSFYIYRNKKSSLPDLKIDYLVLEHNIIDSLSQMDIKNFNTVIIGSSYSRKAETCLRASLDEKKVSYHSVLNDGAFLLDL